MLDIISIAASTSHIQRVHELSIGFLQVQNAYLASKDRPMAPRDFK
jgi:hypothetical protein